MSWITRLIMAVHEPVGPAAQAALMPAAGPTLHRQQDNRVAVPLEQTTPGRAGDVHQQSESLRHEDVLDRRDVSATSSGVVTPSPAFRLKWATVRRVEPCEGDARRHA